MDIAELLVDAYDRIQGRVRQTVKGLTPGQLAYRVDSAANSVGWLVWHLTRVQDDHVADAAGLAQVWIAGGWVQRFGLPFDPADTGYGHSSDEVAAVQVSAEQLVDYYDAVHEQTIGFLRGLTAADLDRIVDTRWDPPVSLGVRLVSVIGDDMQHIGQAAFVRGLVERAGVA